MIKQNQKKTESRLSKHQENMKTILNEWYNLKIELFDIKNGYAKIPIPLYINIVDQFKAIDEFNECISHLKSPEYKEAHNLLYQIESSQEDYNQNVHSLFLGYKTKILGLIEKVENFKLVDEEYFFSIFFDYLNRLSKGESLELIIKVDEDENGIYHRMLHPSHDEEKLLVRALNIENRPVKEVKNVLDKITPEIVTKLEIINEKGTEKYSNLTRFKTELNSIIHNAQILDLYGYCEFEDKIILSKRFVNSLKSFFILKGSIA